MDSDWLQVIIMAAIFIIILSAVYAIIKCGWMAVIIIIGIIIISWLVYKFLIK